MIKFGKLEEGVVKYAPKEIVLEGFVHINPTAEVLARAGYKQVVHVEQPQISNVQKLEMSWLETDTTIEQTWAIIPLTDEEISKKRKIEYMSRTDDKFIQAQREKARGEMDKYNQLMGDWLAECELIKVEFPYNNIIED